MKENKAIKGLIAIWFFVFSFLVGCYLAKASCLTDTQVEEIEILVSSLNLSDNQSLVVRLSMIDLFETLCSKSSNTTEINDNFYNKTEIQSLLASYLNRTDLEILIAQYNWNYTQLGYNLSTLWNESNKVREENKKLEDTIDTRFEDLSAKYYSKKEVDDLVSNTTTNLYEYVKNQQPNYSWVSYVFWGFLAVFGVAVLLYKFRPTTVTRLLKGVKSEPKSIEEITTAKDYQLRIKRLRELKLEATKKKLNREKLIEMLKKIDAGEIQDKDDLDKEAEILRKV